MTIQTLTYIQRTLSANESRGRRETPSDVLLRQTPTRTPNLGTGSDRPDHQIDPKTPGSLSQNRSPRPAIEKRGHTTHARPANSGVTKS